MREGTWAIYLHWYQSYLLAQKLWKLTFDWLVQNIRVKTFQQIIFIYRTGNLVYYHRECTPIYRLLSYSIRTLDKIRRLSYLDFLACHSKIKKTWISLKDRVNYLKLFFYSCFTLLSLQKSIMFYFYNF